MKRESKRKLLKVVSLSTMASSVVAAISIDEYLKNNLKNPKEGKALLVRSITALGIYTAAAVIQLGCKLESALIDREMNKETGEEVTETSCGNHECGGNCNGSCHCHDSQEVAED